MENSKIEKGGEGKEGKQEKKINPMDYFDSWVKVKLHDWLVVI